MILLFQGDFKEQIQKLVLLYITENCQEKRPSLHTFCTQLVIEGLKQHGAQDRPQQVT
jgi:hypothetical protein